MLDSDPDPLVRKARARVGQVLRGKWKLDRLLGVGGMASVYAATHRNGKRGAVKLLHPELSSDEEARTRFLREGYVANRVDHPGAVSVLDDDTTEDGAVFLVMELLEGQTAEDRAQAAGGRLPPADVIGLADQLLDVLAAAHDKGIVHRDLKPENIFVLQSGALKVLDFGIARLREMSSNSHATRTGSLLGTPAFMAPEQALGNWSSVDGRTDVWAAGATMWCMLTGKTVHDADTVNKLLLLAMTKPAPPIASVMPSLPAPLCAVIDRALAFEMDARWPDARAMQAALRAAAGQAHEQASAPQSLRSTASAPAVGPESTGRPSSLTRTTAPVTQAARAATFGGSATTAPKGKGTAAAIAVALATLGTIGAAAFVLLGRSQAADDVAPSSASSATAVAPEVAPQPEPAAATSSPPAEPEAAPATTATAVASAAPAETAAPKPSARAPDAPPRATASPRPPSATAKPASPKKSTDPLEKF